MEFDFNHVEAQRTSPWVFSTGETTMLRMHKAERCYSDCPLVGAPSATIRMTTKYLSNVPIAIEIMMSHFTTGRYHFYGYGARRWAYSNDPNFRRVKEMNLHAPIDRFTGHHNPHGQGNRAADPLPQDRIIPV